MIKTTSIDVSKRLSQALIDAGYNMNHSMVHTEIGFSARAFTYSEFHQMKKLCGIAKEWPDLLPSFTLSELFDMCHHDTLTPSIHKQGNGIYYVAQMQFGLAYLIESIQENPCDAVAELVIWCIENNKPLNLSKITQDEKH